MPGVVPSVLGPMSLHVCVVSCEWAFRHPALKSVKWDVFGLDSPDSAPIGFDCSRALWRHMIILPLP